MRHSVVIGPEIYESHLKYCHFFLAFCLEIKTIFLGHRLQVLQVWHFKRYFQLFISVYYEYKIHGKVSCKKIITDY
jgi:hypothetical protein